MDVYECIKPFNFFLKVFGYFPITLDGKGNFKAHLSDIFLTILMFIVLVIVIFMNIVHLLNLPDPTFINLLWNFSWFIGLCSLMILMLHQLWIYKSSAKFYKAIEHIDSKVSLLKAVTILSSFGAILDASFLC